MKTLSYNLIVDEMKTLAYNLIIDEMKTLAYNLIVDERNENPGLQSHRSREK